MQELHLSCFLSQYVQWCIMACCVMFVMHWVSTSVTPECLWRMCCAIVNIKTRNGAIDCIMMMWCLLKECKEF